MYTWLGNFSCFGLELLSGHSWGNASSLPAPAEKTEVEIGHYEQMTECHLTTNDLEQKT